MYAATKTPPILPNGALQQVFFMSPKLNPHYNFEDPANQAEIKRVAEYDRAFQAVYMDGNGTDGQKAFLAEQEKLALKGQDGYDIGVNVESPWGDNKVLKAEKAEDASDIVTKEITVKPGNMLSLQRHRGRAEVWAVESGTLTVIADGEKHEVTAGDSIELPKGSVHCMVNAHEEPVTVIETQTGICMESDNVRLIDFSARTTVPLLTKSEVDSAILYAEVHADIQQRFGLGNGPDPRLTTPEFRNTAAGLQHGIS